MPICTFMLCQRVAHFFICTYYYPLYMIVAEKQVFLQKLTSAALLVEFIKLHNCPLMVINLINPGIYSVGCRLRRSTLIKKQRRFDRVFSLTLSVTLKIMYLNPWLPKQKRHTKPRNNEESYTLIPEAQCPYIPAAGMWCQTMVVIYPTNLLYMI